MRGKKAKKSSITNGDLLYKYMPCEGHSHSNYHKACLKNENLVRLGVMAHAFNASTWETKAEAEASRFLGVQSQPSQFVQTA